MANLSRRLPSGASSLLRIFSSKPKTDVAAPPQPRLQQEVGLYRRLTDLWCTDGEVTNAINEYIKEGKTVRKVELEKYIKDFRRFKRYRHALETHPDWGVDGNIFKNKDHAIHLDLLLKVKGIAAAENYFNGLPLSRRVSCTYGALLNGYCDEKMSDKALDLFGKMVEENMIVSPLPFNHLMMMYIKLGQPENAVRLEEEMKKVNIHPNTSTYNLLMNGYSLLNDIEGVEGIFEEMTAHNSELCNWTTYSNLANIYIRAGDQEKAKLALEKLEKVMGVHERDAFHFLISLYARISDLDNVRRVWVSLKSNLNVTWNKSYLIMLRSLDNLDDMEGMKECFEEWESVRSSYDVRLANTVIGAYLRRDMLEEAESFLQSAVDKSGPLFHAWENLMTCHLKKHHIKHALQIMETATTSKAHDNGWEPRRDTIDGFLDYFEQESDASSAEKFYELMKRIDCVDSHLYESLLRTYVIAGRKLPDVRSRIERDGVEISSELENLVASVSLG
ncbi:hypothetical protein C2S51_022933 [Perilla frutescens var. frutescens]|nr:hypothetical protein C2S51_022933 [Perilla frutescens var. frutescens]